MDLFALFISALLGIVFLMAILWLISIILHNASIVDLFWGFGFVIIASIYFLLTDGFASRKVIIMSLVAIWGLRLTIFLSWRNFGKPEDFRYQEFRKKFGEKRYWWFSFFQVFLLQGVLMWLISSPILGTMYFTESNNLNVFDYIAIIVWVIGFFFESVGDYQLAKFKANPENKGKVMKLGLWKYTRHPNYFGDAAIWWGFGFFSIASGCYLPFLGTLLMTFLLLRVSGVTMLERSLKIKKQGYKDYMRKTSAFIPWFPKK